MNRSIRVGIRKKMNKNNINTYLSLAFIILVAWVIVWIDDRRGKKAERLNSLGLCARCGESLGCSSDLIPISGGGRSGSRSGQACNKCASIVRLQTIILFSLIALALAGTIIFGWWTGRA